MNYAMKKGGRPSAGRRTTLQRLAAVALLTASVATAGCKAKCADPPEVGSLDDDTVQRMVSAGRADANFCNELRAPRLALTGDDLVLTGAKPRHIARRSDLPATEIVRIERLFDAVSSYRGQWRTVHPGRPFDSDVDLALDPALETPRALSVILSAAYAGAAGARVTTGETSFRVNWFRARPLGPGMPCRIVHVEPGGDGRFVVRRTENGQARGKLEEVTAAREVKSAIDRLCKDAKVCAEAAEIRVSPASRFGETALLVRAVVEALPPLPRRDPSDPPRPEIAVLLAGSEPTTMKMGPEVTYVPRCFSCE